MDTQLPYQPRITKLHLRRFDPYLSEGQMLVLPFDAEYEITWPEPSYRQWRIDIGLFGFPRADEGGESAQHPEIPEEILDGSEIEDWVSYYASLSLEEWRTFGAAAAASVVMASSPSLWSVNKSFGSIKVFIAENYLNLIEMLGSRRRTKAYIAVTEKLIEQVIGDDWSISDYQTDKKRWWRLWRLGLDAEREITKTGTIRLAVPVGNLEAKNESGEFAFYDPEFGWQLLKEKLKVRALARVVEVPIRPTTCWSNML